MKELSIEEKAARYDEAIERVENIKTGKCEITFLFTEGLFEHIFPELKESKDERIKKNIKIALMSMEDNLAAFYSTHRTSQKELLAWLEKQGEQKPAWSEEDEIAFGDALWCCKQAASIAKDENEMGNAWYAERWLKSIKDRVQTQPKQEWSEEDKRKIDRIYSILRQAADTHAFSTTCRLIGDKECIELQDFLKSLKERYTWKPSELQMEALDDFIYAKYPNTEKHGAAVKSLYQDLKELRGE